MAENKIWNYFFCDGYKIAINLFTTIGIILFIIVIYKTIINKRSSNFKLLFIIMINVMISGILSPLGYLLNWKVKKDNSEEKELLFGKSEGFLCQTQSFILAFFQSTRETFVTLLLSIVFIKYLSSKDLNTDKIFIKFLVIIMGYGIPFIANLTYSLIGAFGESHLFCFTNLNTSGVTSICGTIHFTYILILLILSIFMSLYILIKECCFKSYDPWTDNDNNSDQKCCMNSELMKIMFYPIAQFFSMFLIFYYRFRDYFLNNIKDDKYFISGTCAVINAISSIIYTIIFIFSNNIFGCLNRKKITNKDIENKVTGELLVE